LDRDARTGRCSETAVTGRNPVVTAGGIGRNNRVELEETGADHSSKRYLRRGAAYLDDRERGQRTELSYGTVNQG